MVDERERETKCFRLASMTTSQDTSQRNEGRTFWDHVNGGELNAHEVHQARQLEAEHWNHMHVFERVPHEFAKFDTRRETIKVRWVDIVKAVGFIKAGK